MKKGKIFIISGPSAVGQGTVIKELLKDDNLNLSWPKSYTTRKARPSDQIENKYFFVSADEFKNLEKKGEIFESVLYDGTHYYGSSKLELENAVNSGQNVIKDIEYKGAMAYKKLFPETILIFLFSDIDTIQSRLENRGQNTQSEIEERLKVARYLLSKRNHYDYVIENVEGSPAIAINQISKIIRQSGSSRSH